MVSTGVDTTLARRIARGEYAIDEHAVAEAIMRRFGLRASDVLIAPQAVDPSVPGVEHDEPAAGRDAA